MELKEIKTIHDVILAWNNRQCLIDNNGNIFAIEYVKLGFHIGVGGVVTFKNGRKLKEVVENIPIEMIVTETDAPWLSPTPHRGERNDSSYIKYVIEEIARLKGMDVEKAADMLYNNALDVYNLH